jgi:hypothetical protein
VTAILQKIKRPTVEILGTRYSSRIVDLHNRMRAGARTLLVYKDIARLGAAKEVRGVFLPRERRLVIYLRRGAPEATVAHELIHAILYTDGFLPMRCRSDDLIAFPAIGRIARALNDLLVHPVVHAHLQRAGYATGEVLPAGHSPRRGKIARPPRPGVRDGAGSPADAGFESHVIGHLAAAIERAESLLRLGIDREAPPPEAGPGGRASSTDLSRRLAAAAPWDPRRTPVDARVRAAAMMRLLEEEAFERWGARLSLPERILMPPYLTKARLEAPSLSIFDVRQGGQRGDVVLIVFVPDQTACSARVYSDAARALRVVTALRGGMSGTRAASFADRHRLQYLVIEGGRRYRPNR